jgi:hypothetical protein
MTQAAMASTSKLIRGILVQSKVSARRRHLILPYQIGPPGRLGTKRALVVLIASLLFDASSAFGRRIDEGIYTQPWGSELTNPAADIEGGVPRVPSSASSAPPALTAPLFRDKSGIIEEPAVPEFKSTAAEVPRWLGANRRLPFNGSLFPISRASGFFERSHMRNSLVTTAAVRQSQNFFELQLTPQWGAADELQVEVSNWSKSSLALDRLVVELALRGARPCRFNYERRLELGPTATITPTIADSNATQDCLETQGVASVNTLRFVHPIECFGAGRANIFKAKAQLEVQGRTVQSQICWLVEAESP